MQLWDVFLNVKNVINMKKLTKEQLLKVIDTFLLYGRITSEQYAELTQLLNETYIDEEVDNVTDTRTID